MDVLGSLQGFWKAALRFISRNTHVQFWSQGALMFAAGYLTLKDLGLVPPLFGKVSAYITLEFWIKIKEVGGIVVGISIAIQMLSKYLEFYPITRISLQKPVKIAECLLHYKLELCRQLDLLDDENTNFCDGLCPINRFDLSLSLILSGMADHFKQAFPAVRRFENNLFISVYQYRQINRNRASLNYLRHWPPMSETIFSPEIPISDPNYADYECVKLLNADQTQVFKWNCSDYCPSRNGRRRGNISHYVGFQIAHNGRTLGFVNIEFLNHRFFDDEAGMHDFAQEEIIAFRYLIEYLFLRKEFLSTVKAKIEEATP